MNKLLKFEPMQVKYKDVTFRPINAHKGTARLLGCKKEWTNISILTLYQWLAKIWTHTKFKENR